MNNRNARDQFLYNGLSLQYQSNIERAKYKLSVYLDNPVGVGDHECIDEVIEKQLEVIDKNKSMLVTLQETFTVSETTTAPEGELPNDEG